MRDAFTPNFKILKWVATSYWTLSWLRFFSSFHRYLSLANIFLSQLIKKAFSIYDSIKFYLLNLDAVKSYDFSISFYFKREYATKNRSFINDSVNRYLWKPNSRFSKSYLVHGLPTDTQFVNLFPCFCRDQFKCFFFSFWKHCFCNWNSLKVSKAGIFASFHDYFLSASLSIYYSQ